MKIGERGLANDLEARIKLYEEKCAMLSFEVARQQEKIDGQNLQNQDMAASFQNQQYFSNQPLV